MPDPLDDFINSLPIEDQFERDGVRRCIETVFHDPRQQLFIMRLCDIVQNHKYVIEDVAKKEAAAGQSLCDAIKILNEQVMEMVIHIGNLEDKLFQLSLENLKLKKGVKK